MAFTETVIVEVRAEGKALGLAEGKQLGLAEGKALGLVEGKALGFAAGKAVGLAEGAVRGKREALLLLLAARGCLLGSAHQARILAEQDPDRLDRWILRAATCTDIADVVSEP